MLKGNVLITGGAGFLGRAILARAKREDWPARFTVYSRDEQKQDACRNKFPDVAYVLGDIRDPYLLPAVMANQDIVIHAGAMKYVPESEYNVTESISINVLGTQMVVQAVLRSKVHTMVFISTDKVVEPLNTYGITKALGEKIMFESSRLFPQRFISVRYGNVVGSTGSVVPVFKRMAAQKNEITITDPGCTRFWISADDAINLILAAIVAGSSGSICIPQPQSMAIGLLAETICPGVPTRLIGLRPGEKRHEKLLSLSEAHHISRFNDWYEHHVDYNSVGIDELTSDTAERMKPETFLALVEQAALI